ncbi:MAG: 50S ribosomal protein L24 [Deltaproteobacteria bacterium]|nr:50S ribosomal protein L24 [Deltaproteobacteria bacterium]
MFVRKDDTVMVVAGKERGKTGKVIRVVPKKSRVFIERVNLVKRHSKPRSAQQPGGIVEKEASIHVSNVMIMCDPCNAPVRIGHKVLEDGEKVRVCRRCGQSVG